MPKTVEDALRAISHNRWLLGVAVAGGAALGPGVKAVVLLGREAREAWLPSIYVGALAGFLAALAWVLVRSTAARLRVTEVTLKLGSADVKVALDPDSRQQLWRFFIEMTSRVSTRGLAPEDGDLEEALGSLYSLFDRARADLGTRPPSEPSPAGTSPAHIYVLDILNDDLRPCLARWHVRRTEWKRTGLPESDWPLRLACRDDLEATRLRVVERAWQLGKALGIPDLDRLLPARPDVVPSIMTPEALLEVNADVPLDAETLKAGWQIFVEMATRIATQQLPASAGMLGEAITSLYTLTGEIRSVLKAAPPARSGGRDDSIEGLALNLLNQGIRPFLADWHPRYETFKATNKPENEWDQAAACRDALEATRQRCLPIVRRLGEKINAPPLP